MHAARVALLCVCLIIACSVGAQSVDFDPFLGQPMSIETRGGAVYHGRVLAVSDERVELLVPEGEIITLALAEVISAVPLDEGRGSRAYYEDSASNRLLVAPTAFPMRRGEFHVADQQLALVTASYGVTDTLSAWVGTSVPGAVMSLRASAVVLPGLGLSGGAFVGTTWFDPSVWLAIPYLVTSIGEPDNNVTLAFGYPTVIATAERPSGGLIAVVGAKRTVSSRTAIVFETWILADPAGGVADVTPEFIAPAIAFRIASSRLSWDIGVITPVLLSSGAEFFAAPWLGLTYRLQ